MLTFFTIKKVYAIVDTWLLANYNPFLREATRVLNTPTVFNSSMPLLLPMVILTNLMNFQAQSFPSKYLNYSQHVWVYRQRELKRPPWLSLDKNETPTGRIKTKTRWLAYENYGKDTTQLIISRGGLNQSHQDCWNMAIARTSVKNQL